MKNWFIRFTTSSIGRKLLMALTGIFLILFLAVHLVGNLQLLKDDNGAAFNLYADFMSQNPLIQFISKGNFFFILLHAVLGTYLWLANGRARGSRGYAVKKTRATATNPFFARYMWFLGVIVFVFILIHLYQFWFAMHYAGDAAGLTLATYDGTTVKDLYSLVKVTFSDPFFVVFYAVCMAVIGFHLWHGFHSAFQTIGWNHPKYTPLIAGLGKVYAVVVPAGFALIPIVFYLRHA